MLIRSQLYHIKKKDGHIGCISHHNMLMSALMPSAISVSQQNEVENRRNFYFSWVSTNYQNQF